MKDIQKEKVKKETQKIKKYSNDICLQNYLFKNDDNINFNNADDYQTEKAILIKSNQIFEGTEQFQNMNTCNININNNYINISAKDISHSKAFRFIFNIQIINILTKIIF